MRREKNKYILENRTELNKPMFADIKSTRYYHSVPESSGWRVILHFKQPNDPRDWKMETDWAWLPKDLQMKLIPIP